MRSVNTDPAAARNVEDWDQIPWPKLHDNVRRLAGVNYFFRRAASPIVAGQETADPYRQGNS